MPKRQTTVKISGGPQGDDAWVEMYLPTWGEIKDAFYGEKPRTDELLEDTLIEWNWTDEDGELLEVSLDNLNVIERRFLLDALLNPESDGYIKN